MKKLLSLLAVLIFFSFMSCRNEGEKVVQHSRKPLTRKQLIDFNRKLMRQEKRNIDAFIKAHHWNMKESGTGLRYQVLVKGKGETARRGEMAKIRYFVKLFDGKKIVSGVKSFKIGYGGVESGLEEGIILLNKGEEARFILPSHLAYGLSGDGNKIPPNSPLIYRVKLLDLK